jgi:hypothetical protein
MVTSFALVERGQAPGVSSQRTEDRHSDAISNATPTQRLVHRAACDAGFLRQLLRGHLAHEEFKAKPCGVESSRADVVELVAKVFGDWHLRRCGVAASTGDSRVKRHLHIMHERGVAVHVCDWLWDTFLAHRNPLHQQGFQLHFRATKIGSLFVLRTRRRGATTPKGAIIDALAHHFPCGCASRHRYRPVDGTDGAFSTRVQSSMPRTSSAISGAEPSRLGGAH